MSIIAQNDSGWLICPLTYVNNIYESCLEKKSLKCELKFRKVFYQIDTPLLMNSAAFKKVNQVSDSRKKKKVKKTVKTNNDSHNKICSTIGNVTEELVKLGRNKYCYFQSSNITETEWLNNNSSSREAFKSFTCIDKKEIDPKEIFLHGNSSDIPLIKEFGQQEYVLPSKSSFLLSDIMHIDLLCDTTYDLIMMDPPWMNKSVRRKKGYSTLPCESLLHLPVTKLSSPGCLIVVWATNNDRQMTFVKDTLFPKWNVQFCSDWHWVKVTRKGDFIHPLDSDHKKPYENLIIGRKKFDDCPDSILQRPIIEPHKVIVSVPSSIHSHKPPLADILKPYLPENPRCLELFARYLLPGWTSWGNEVLKLQNLHLFDRIYTESSSSS